MKTSKKTTAFFQAGKHRHLSVRSYNRRYNLVTPRHVNFVPWDRKANLNKQLYRTEILDFIVDLVKCVNYCKSNKWFYDLLLYNNRYAKTIEEVKELLRLAFEWQILEEDDVRQELQLAFHKHVRLKGFVRDHRPIVKTGFLITILSFYVPAFLIRLKVFRNTYYKKCLMEEGPAIPNDIERPIPQITIEDIFNPEDTIFSKYSPQERYYIYLSLLGYGRKEIEAKCGISEWSIRFLRKELFGFERNKDAKTASESE